MFSLIEIVVVILIISLTAGVVAAVLKPMSPKMAIKSTATELQKIFSAVRSKALTSGKNSIIKFSPANKTFYYFKKKLQLHDSIKTDAENILENSNELIWTFFPDGAGTGPEINLKSGSFTRKLNISALTGNISFIKNQEEL